MTHCHVPPEPSVQARGTIERHDRLSFRFVTHLSLFHSIGRCVRVEERRLQHTTYTCRKRVQSVIEVETGRADADIATAPPLSECENIREEKTENIGRLFGVPSHGRTVSARRAAGAREAGVLRVSKTHLWGKRPLLVAPQDAAARARRDRRVVFQNLYRTVSVYYTLDGNVPLEKSA